MTTSEQVKKIILEILDIPESEFKPDESLREGLGATSVDLVEIVAAIENDFDIDIPEDDLPAMTTFNEIVAYLEERAAQ